MSEFARASVFLILRALGVLFPYLGVYAKSLGSTRSFLSCIAYIAYFSFSFAFLLVLRDPTSGGDAGYGADAQYYMDAFDSLGKINGFDVSEILETGLIYTGSAEPLFWVTSYALSALTGDPLTVWWCIGFLTLFLIGISASTLDKNLSFYILAIFVSTITYYVFPGSGLRQGMAFSILFCAVVELFKNNKFLCTTFSALAVLAHSSSLPVAVVLISSAWDSRKISTKAIKLLLVLIATVGFYYIQSAQIESKFATYSEIARQDLAYVQAAVEGAFLIGLMVFFRRLFPSQFKKSFYLFVVTLLAVAVFFQGGGFERYYRYLYVFGILILAAVSAAKPTFLRVSLFFSCSWLCFIVLSRYSGLFVKGGFFEHVFFSPIYIFLNSIFV